MAFACRDSFPNGISKLNIKIFMYIKDEFLKSPWYCFPKVLTLKTYFDKVLFIMNTSIFLVD